MATYRKALSFTVDLYDTILNKLFPVTTRVVTLATKEGFFRFGSFYSERIQYRGMESNDDFCIGYFELHRNPRKDFGEDYFDLSYNVTFHDFPINTQIFSLGSKDFSVQDVNSLHLTLEYRTRKFSLKN